MVHDDNGQCSRFDAAPHGGAREDGDEPRAAACSSRPCRVSGCAAAAWPGACDSAGAATRWRRGARARGDGAGVSRRMTGRMTGVEIRHVAMECR